MNSPLPRRERLVEARQVLRRHGQVGVEDHQHVAAAPARSRGARRRPCPCPSGAAAGSGARDGAVAPFDRRRRCRRSSGPRRRPARCRRPSPARARRWPRCCRLRCAPGRSPRPMGGVSRRGRRAPERTVTKLVRASQRNGQRWTRNLLKKGPSSGTSHGQQHLFPVRDDLEARQVGGGSRGPRGSASSAGACCARVPGAPRPEAAAPRAWL